MKSSNQIISCLKKENLLFSELGNDGMAVQIVKDKVDYRIVASWGGRWDHVSVSLPDRCPIWDEMCWIKDIFWNPHETVIQYHPSKENYKNDHPFCLHMWKPQRVTIPLPPKDFV